MDENFPLKPVVIFDMDGLMVDSELLQSISFKGMLKKHGIIVRKKIVQILGVRAVENIKMMKKKYRVKESVKTLFQEKNVIYSQLLKRKIKPMPGLFKLIEALKKSKIRLALASSSNYDHIRTVLSKLGLEKQFEVILSGEHVKKGKPNAEIYLKTAKILRIKPELCLVLEDAQTGVSAAKNAQMKCIAVPNKYTRNKNFSRSDLIVKSLDDITIETILKIM